MAIQVNKIQPTNVVQCRAEIFAEHGNEWLCLVRGVSSPASGLSQEQTAHVSGKRVRPQEAASGTFPEYCCRDTAEEVPEFHTAKWECLGIS